ncbi:hypothetical protein HMPREF9141_2192 [Prevotella multiformis DSM 16608]|uniref:Uncharacterized protein n=1 Tax=Prevotella multiformis DSM 16608 TaxID=888743 RepID=F0F9C5_9BACT|nr:hypothetical protein HMPREF9141_2192 [Prevotella multiformis DSM 16608]
MEGNSGRILGNLERTWRKTKRTEKTEDELIKLLSTWRKAKRTEKTERERIRPLRRRKEREERERKGERSGILSPNGNSLCRGAFPAV